MSLRLEQLRSLLSAAPCCTQAKGKYHVAEAGGVQPDSSSCLVRVYPTHLSTIPRRVDEHISKPLGVWEWRQTWLFGQDCPG